MKLETITHAGGVVYRLQRGAVQYLLVGPKKEVPGEWLLPKGHIENGENTPEAAVREVREETGIVAGTDGLAGTDRFTFNREKILVHYFLMKRLAATKRDEARRMGWFGYDEAHQLLTHPRNKELLQAAEVLRLKSARPRRPARPRNNVRK
jgi:8-oxo-dGTP pyrophosphatase MutT (NUDIX family)